MPRTLPLVALAALLVGCDAADPSGPPDVISPAAFTVGTDGFPEAGARVAAGPHFLNAAVRVGVVSAVVGAHLVLPAQATAAATAATPVAEAGVFVWDTNVAVFGTDVEVRLLGAPEGREVAWTLTTAVEGDERFTYYTAATSFDGREGTWTLFSPDVSGPVLTAAFDVDDTPEVTFAVPEGRPQGGASVRYAVDGDLRTFDLAGADGARALIQWDVETRVGSIEADDYNGGERACWDADLRDVPCEGV